MFLGRKTPEERNFCCFRLFALFSLAVGKEGNPISPGKVERGRKSGITPSCYRSLHSAPSLKYAQRIFCHSWSCWGRPLGSTYMLCMQAGEKNINVDSVSADKAYWASVNQQWKPLASIPQPSAVPTPAHSDPLCVSGRVFKPFV